MAERETSLTVSTKQDTLGELRNANDVFGKPDEDKERAPQFEKRIYLIKKINNAQMFEGEDPESGERVRTNEVRGVLIHFNATRSWWEKSLDDGGGGQAPDCHSVDGIRPLDSSPKKQCDTCAACPRNKFIKDDKGKTTKECSDKVELFLWHPKFGLPLFYRVSTMNRPVITDFINWCAKQGIRKEFFTLKLTLAPTKNKAGVAYDQLKIEVTGDIRDLTQWYKQAEGVEIPWQDIADQLQSFKEDNAETFGMALGEENATPPEAPADEKKKEAANPASGVTGAGNPPF